MSGAVMRRKGRAMNKKCKSNSQLRILLVEDDVVIQCVHTMMLERLGSQIDVAGSGEDALAKINNQYDLIFMDIGLPGISGIETIKRIRASDSKIKDLPIVVLTALNYEETKSECVTAGATALFVKPVSIEEFQKILKKFCQ